MAYSNVPFERRCADPTLVLCRPVIEADVDLIGGSTEQLPLGNISPHGVELHQPCEEEQIAILAVECPHGVFGCGFRLVGDLERFTWRWELVARIHGFVEEVVHRLAHDALQGVDVRQAEGPEVDELRDRATNTQETM